MKTFIPKFHLSTLFYLLLCFYLKWYKEPILLLGIILFHEYAHYLVAYLLGYDVEGIVVYPFGAFLRINDYGYKEIWKDLGVAIAGGCSHLLLFALGDYFRGFMGVHLYHYFLQFNWQVLLFNLLPIYPMDGAKILLCILSSFIDYLICLKMLLILSFLGLVLLMIYCFDASYIVVYSFLIMQIYKFSQTFYYEYTMTILRRSGNNRRKAVLHDDVTFLRGKQNFYLFNGAILDEKSFIKSRIFIDNKTQ